MIGRVVIVHPSQGETFYLRRFEDFRTVNGCVCETFKQSCKLLNFLQDGNEWFFCLNEATNALSPAFLRGLFVTI